MTFDDLANAVVVITGGGSGIGRAVCQQLAECNAKVIIADLDFEKAQETQSLLKDPARHLPVRVNVSSSTSVDELVKWTEEFGECPLGVVHSAGIVTTDPKRRSCLQSTEESWDKIVDINLKGTYLINTAFARLMKKHQVSAGSIVNISSIARNGFAPNIEYSASKAGQIGITKTLAQELGAINIRVNAVAPGATKTPLTAAVPKEMLDAIAAANPMQRIGEAEEVAAVCLFLLSKASSYVTGQVIDVSGGISVQQLSLKK